MCEYILQRSCAPAQSVLLAASVPLTAKPGWQPLSRGELLAVGEGAIVPRALTLRREMAAAA